jgi:hypothetical protein
VFHFSRGEGAHTPFNFLLVALSLFVFWGRRPKPSFRRALPDRLSMPPARGALPRMKVILTGATGMVGEGVLLECLSDPSVEHVLSVSRRPCEHTHPKLEEQFAVNWMRK